MAGFKTALKIATFPFRTIWLVLLVGNFLIVAIVRLMLGCFLVYGALLAFSYALLPVEWTQALWQSAADLYAKSAWFKAAVISSFTICCLPILKVWPGELSLDEKQREFHIMRLHDDLIAARLQDELRARLRA